jgi:hypothetical protein
MKDAVAYLHPVTLLKPTTKSENFNTDLWAINNNNAISIVMNIIAASGLSGTVQVQASLDNSTWINLKNQKTSFAGDDDILFTLTELDPLYYIRLSVTISSGSAIFNIQARAT